ncbi:hypothetical protein CYMTET_13593 [Cymbomonas tetramitiformis]|uniref:Prolyl 4-hydroxylase alpha subunit domain-containing protein n=1 Tax=Cymbomonas tetramitiformis TaxID=36881 RepID=A0AAE0GI59_9CHLO|nr:hypothetical protein CYMTET_13593 [Cymbomonas tetramitiformis]
MDQVLRKPCDLDSVPPAKKMRMEDNVNKVPLQLQKLCSKPKTLLYSDFLTDQECDHLLGIAEHRNEWTLSDLTPEYSSTFLRPLDRFFDPVVRNIEERIAVITKIPCHNLEDPVKISKYTPLLPAKSARGNAPLLNLHHDRNPSRPERVVTVIIYLTDVEAGGHTFFPCTMPHPESLDTIEGYTPHDHKGVKSLRPQQEPIDKAASPESKRGVAREEPIASGTSQILRKDAIEVEASPEMQHNNVAGEELADMLEKLYKNDTVLLPSSLDEGAAVPGETVVLHSVEGQCSSLLNLSCKRGQGQVFNRSKSGGLLVTPTKGSALIFWSIDSGAIEARYGWHGAVQVTSVTPHAAHARVTQGLKVAAQKFKEAPRDDEAMFTENA